jgi:hypothetical protein
MKNKTIVLKLSANDPELGYVSLPNHPHLPGCVVKQTSLYELIGEYIGPSIFLDFTNSGELIGIEIVP